MGIDFAAGTWLRSDCRQEGVSQADALTARYRKATKGDPKGVVASCAEECCRMAILVSEIDKRIHWLEAAARWLSLGREQGVLLPRRSQSRLSPRGLPELRH